MKGSKKMSRILSVDDELRVRDLIKKYAKFVLTLKNVCGIKIKLACEYYK